MSKDLNYWYSGIGKGGVESQLPPQAVSSSEKKTEKWQKATMDALERIGVNQLVENLKFQDFYRMVEGKMAYAELSDVMPQLREVGAMLNDLDIPTFIKHYDLIGIIVNALVGEYIQTSDKFNVTNVDEISTNEYERDKKELVSKYIKENIDKELQLRLLERGLNPDLSAINFKSEEEKQAYIQNLEANRQELTPPEIQKFMDTSWRTKASIWGEHTLEADKEYYKLDKLDREELRDFLLTGRCFRHFMVGYDYYKPETWSPLNTFFKKTVDTKYIEDGEYVGRVHFYSPSQIINRYGHLLTKTQKEKLVGKGVYNYYTDANTNGEFSFMKALESNFGETHIVPHKQHYDYEFMLGLQNEFGVPLGEKTIMKKDGTEAKVPVYFPDTFAHTSRNRYANELRTDIRVGEDLVQVTEAYWVSYKKIGYLTYITETGRLTQDIVTDDVLLDFLKENNIKQLSTKTLDEIEANPEPNTIVWDYVPEVWQGIKINEGNSFLDEPIYLNIKPLDYQIKGHSNVYDVKLPVVGIVDSSLALKLQPFQVSHNVAMNQAYNYMEKEIGMFFIFDINFLPSEFKEWGDSEETLIHLRNLVKDVGMLGVDSSKQNIRDAGSFNQFGVQNLSFGSIIQEKLAIADTYKYRAFEQVGFNPQRLGSPVKYQTATGVEQSQMASYSQTEVYFETFGDYKKNALEMHLCIAQYAQKNEKDIKVFYTKSDSSKAFLKFTDPYFKLRNLGILPVSNSKKRKELENFKNYLLNNNTLNGDLYSVASLFTSDTMVELIESARLERLNAQKDAQVQRQHEIEIEDRKIEAVKQQELTNWQREEYSKQKDRENKIEVEKIDALGRAADNNADADNLNFIISQANLAIQKEKNNKEISIKETEQIRKSEKDKQDYYLRLEELKNETLKIATKNKEIDTNKYISQVNKN